jgi:hypothetical protein
MMDQIASQSCGIASRINMARSYRIPCRASAAIEAGMPDKRPCRASQLLPAGFFHCISGALNGIEPSAGTPEDAALADRMGGTKWQSGNCGFSWWASEAWA